MTLTAQELYQRGTALVCVGRYAEAIEWFDHALERNPRNKEVLVALATAVDRLGLFREAVISCEKAIEIDNQYPDAWFVKGLALFRLSDTEAGGCFQILVDRDHSHAEAWFKKGNCHYQLGEFNDPIHCYEKMIYIHQKYSKAFYNLAVALAETGRYEEAIQFYDQCLAMNPGVGTVMTNKAVALARLGRYERQKTCSEKRWILTP
jgi:tetratricopeptide (TPR) repeat protein